MLLQSLAFMLLTWSVAAQDNLGFDADPYLEYRPDFARSLPVQILLTGVVLTLVAVLFIHLLFTAQYHWPLAPVNYVLQMSGVTTLLISLIATLHVVLAATIEESLQWPYMLSYIAVNVPPLEDGDYAYTGWSSAERATWLIMNATTSGLIQITHIQFLTLLYPSKLEGRLVFSLLGPLAVLAAVMQLLPIVGSHTVDAVASVIRNVCNATLSLLFTVSLFVWGVLVNRDQAWRTDGGTAAFGCAALSLAVVSTALNFLYIPREEEYVWLPALMWAVVLWQSFLGWWWWVGAGSGTGLYRNDTDGSDDLARRERRRTKRKRMQHSSPLGTTRECAQTVWRGVAGRFSNHSDDVESTTLRHRSTEPSRSRSHSHSRSRPRGEPSSRSNAAQDGPAVPSEISDSSTATLPHFLPQIVHRWYASLRQAHLTAARKQAIERAARIRELERSGAPNSTQTGWGLGSFAWRVHRPAARRGSSVSPHDRPSRSRRAPSPETFVLSDLSRRSREANHLDEEETVETVKPHDLIHSYPALQRPPPVPPLRNYGAVVGGRRSLWWWEPLRRWRLKDSTIY